MRFSSRVLAACTVMAVVAIVAQVAIAQNERGQRNRGSRGGGPGGMGGRMMSIAQLAGNEKVQEALKLTDDQKTKIKQANDDARKVMEEMRDGGQFDFEKVRKSRDEASAKVTEALDEGQRKKLLGTFVAVAGTGAVMDPSVAKELNITDEQKDKLHEAMGPPPGAPGEGGGDRQSFADRRAKTDKAIADTLTSEQKDKLEKLKGDKVDVDMSQLRPGGGQRPGRGERRNRGADQPAEKKSA